MKLIFAGDFCPLDGYDIRFQPEVRALFEKADYSFVNLECPLTNSVEKLLKSGPNLKASPDRIKILKELGANCVTLANNHIKDYSSSGVVDTIKLCEDNNLMCVGAGEDIDLARNFLLLEKNGETVVVVNIAENEFNIAGKREAGANPFDLINILKDLDDARKVSPNIVLVIHGGREHVDIPSPESFRVLRFLAEQKNVRAVIRHHPHIIQGKEYHNGIPIYYSLGNFIVPQKSDRTEHWWEGLVVELDISDGCVCASEKKIKADRRVANEFCLKISESVELPSLDEKRAREVWREEFNKHAAIYRINTIIPLPYKLIAILSRLGIVKLMGENRVAKCYLRCEAHLEMLRHAFGAAKIDE